VIVRVLNPLKLISLLSVFFFVSLDLKAQNDTLLDVLQEELSREMNELSKAEIPPYYIHYRVDEINENNISSSFGSLTRSFGMKNRILVTDVRVGDYTMDNTHQLENEQMYRGDQQFNNPMLPIDNNKKALQYALWQDTKGQYNSALKAYKLIKNASENKKEAAKTAVPDFSKEKPEQYFEEPLKDVNNLDKKIWEERLKRFSSLFASQNGLTSGDVDLRFTTERKYFVSTEGTKIVQNLTYAYLTVSASIRAEDGDIIPLYNSYFAFTPDKLPSDDLIIKEIKEMIAKLELLKKAPLAEPYSGPAILHARSAGVFFHEIFGHRVEGHRLRDEEDGQTFKSKINEQVLPKFMKVVFDPTIRQFNHFDLIGSYQYDDEGVKSRKVVAVQDGILKNFLISRTPLEDFSTSNGHGRAAAGLPTVSRQSNLIVENSKPESFEQLRKRLVKECQKQKKKYGYLFKDVIGGFTTTQRYMPNAFNIMPTEVYRVYVDGRPDELVRGVDLIGTPLSMFAEIVAGTGENEIFTGYCGAESGNVPVSAIAPSLLVRRIETQKKMKVTQEETLLARPYAETK
jgi:TldD protein